MKYLQLLMVLFGTSFFLQANTICPEVEPSESTVLSDSIVCDILIDGTSLPGFNPLDSMYYVALGYNSIIPTVTLVPCDSANEVYGVTYVDATSFPGTTVITIETANGDAVFYINWFYEASASDSIICDILIDGTSLLEFNPADTTYDLYLGCEPVPEISFITCDSIIIVDSSYTETVQGDLKYTFYTATDSVSYYFSLFFSISLEEASPEVIRISPNPSHGMLNIQSSSGTKSRLSLIGPSGGVLQYIELNEGQLDHTFDVSQYPTGLYFIEVYRDGRLIQTEKLMID